MRSAPALCLLLLFGLASCAPPAPEVTEGCGLVQAHAVAFSEASTSDITAGDVAEARSFGPDCANAVVSLTLRANDGTPLWVFAAPARTVFPETAAGAVDPAAAVEAMDTLLRRWVRVSVSTTASQPDWAPMAAAPGAAPPALQDGPSGPAAPWSTPFDPATYADIRSRGLPMACYETSPDSADCVYWEPAVGEALLFVQFER